MRIAGSGLSSSLLCYNHHMARPLRIEFSGALYHITSRGDRKEDIFLSDDDRLLFLEIYSRTAERYGWICHAYCLMPNHYHLVIETPLPNLSAGMAYLNGVYTQKFNKKNGKVGHLFQGRFKAILVQRESYLLELLRYVVLNPVRADLVSDPGEWQWSNFCATAGLVERPEWLNISWVLSCFGDETAKARQEYISFVQQGLKWGENIWDDLKKQIYLGNDEFVDEMQELLVKDQAFDDIPKEQVSSMRKKIDEFLSYPDPMEGMARAYLEGRYTLKEVGKAFGVHVTTVSRIVKKWEERTRAKA